MSAGVYVPRAKLLALQAEANKPQNAGPSQAEEPSKAATGYTDEDVASWPEARRYFYKTSATFKELQNAKKAFNENPDVEEMFNKNRMHSTDKPISRTFADQFYTCMDDINNTAGNLLGNGDIQRYLDLGCSPGGFSTWVMSKNPKAKGLGITLPVEMAGLPMVSFPEGDYIVKYRDITKLDQVEKEIKDAEMDEMDLVMAACIYRDHETNKAREPGNSEPQAPLAARSLLSLSQIHIALKHLRQDGHFVFVLSNKPDPATLQTLVLLRSLFKSITPCKGKSLHGIRSSFYLFCDSFDKQEYEHSHTSELLLKAMADMKDEEEKQTQREIESIANRTEDLQIGERTGGDPQADSDIVHPADLIWMRGVTLDALLEQEGPFVSKFFDGLWNGQIRAIAKRTDELKYKNTRSSEGNASRSPWRRTSEKADNGTPRSWRAQKPDAAGGTEQGTWQTATRGSGNAPRSDYRRSDTPGGEQTPAPARETNNALKNDWRKR